MSLDAQWHRWGRILRFRGPIGRLGFFVGLAVCLLVKQGVDRGILAAMAVPYTGRIWDILLGMALPTEDDLSWGWPLLVASLPFVWIGLALTTARLRALRRSPAWALLFFVPGIKFIFVLLLLGLPEPTDAPREMPAPPRLGRSRWIPRNRWASAAMGAALTSVLGALSVLLIANYLEAYGWALFVALPFLMGFVTTLVHNHHEVRNLRESCLCSLAALALLGAQMILYAIEGLICLLMASPIAVVLALIGTVVAHALSSASLAPRVHAGVVPSAAFLLLPILTLAELRFRPPPEIRPVSTEVTIAAPPQTVWRHVVSFADLPPPTDWVFRTGIAYPIRARLEGRGVGAVRYCEFSTGAFVEPIEVWDEPRRLAFSVTDYPAPMEEWTPYRHIHPPHLDDFLVSKRGQFELMPTADGGTRLVGTTWYRHGLMPEIYWRWWSDAILHRIHARVLEHIRNLAEGGVSRP